LKFPIIDTREKEDILKDIKTFAKKYTPEWNYDEEDPDFGVIFSKIFADLFSGNVDKFNIMPYNHYVDFLNMLGAKLNPAIPATGMVNLKVGDGFDGEYVGNNAQAFADGKNGRIIYQVLDSMYAINEKIKSIYLTDSNYNIICEVFNSLKENKINFKLFDAVSYENLQEHVLYLNNDYLFSAKNNSEIKIEFKDNSSMYNNKRLPEIFSDKENVTWQYYKDNEWKNIENIEKTETGIKLKFKDFTDIFKYEKYNIKSKFLRCLFKKIPEGGLRLNNILYSSENKDLPVDAVLLDNLELTDKDFFPFGEQFGFYSSFYIKSDEAFSKKNSNIEINIDIKFLKIEVEKIPMPDMTRYRYIMSEIDFQKEDLREASIEKVEWEYWNGNGWKKLFKNKENEEFFIVKEEPEIRSLKFTCPEDLETNKNGPQIGYFIRARISKVKNFIGNIDSFISPFIKEIKINYNYENLRNCEKIYITSNLKDYEIELKEDCEVQSLMEIELYNYPCMYFCLENPINKGPVRIFFEVEPSTESFKPSLIWQYWSKNDKGEHLWKNLEISDNTRNFLNNGVITVIGRGDHEKNIFFNQEGYFLRIVNIDKKYDVLKNINLYPKIEDINFNAANIIQNENNQLMEFKIDFEESNKILNLNIKNILDIQVFVNEAGYLTARETEELDPEQVEIKYNERGKIEEVWFEWHKVNNISCAGVNERAFEVDLANGILKFGDNTCGKIPCHQEDKASIRVKFSTCLGSEGNVPEDKVKGLMTFYKNITEISNSKPVIGGVDMETMPEIFKRIPTQIAQMGRAVSLDDFENMILFQERTIEQVKCLPHVNQNSEPEPGIISIAILPRDYLQGYEKFLIIRKRLKELIKKKGPLNLTANSKSIKIFEVDYIEISVNIEIVINDYNHYQQVYQDVEEKLKNFLNPITGNFTKKGWEIGELPRKEVIYSCIKKIKNLALSKNLRICTKAVTKKGKQDVDYDDVIKKAFTVPVYGEPNIKITVITDESYED